MRNNILYGGNGIYQGGHRTKSPPWLVLKKPCRFSPQGKPNRSRRVSFWPCTFMVQSPIHGLNSPVSPPSQPFSESQALMAELKLIWSAPVPNTSEFRQSGSISVQRNPPKDLDFSGLGKPQKPWAFPLQKYHQFWYPSMATAPPPATSWPSARSWPPWPCCQQRRWQRCAAGWCWEAARTRATPPARAPRGPTSPVMPWCSDLRPEGLWLKVQCISDLDSSGLEIVLPHLGLQSEWKLLQTYSTSNAPGTRSLQCCSWWHCYANPRPDQRP